jgi:hypothetical protein
VAQGAPNVEHKTQKKRPTCSSEVGPLRGVRLCNRSLAQSIGEAIRWRKSGRSHALESAGVIFVDENGEGPGVRLARQLAVGPRNSRGAVRAQHHGLNPTMKAKKVLISIVHPFGVSRKSIHPR